MHAEVAPQAVAAAAERLKPEAERRRKREAQRERRKHRVRIDYMPGDEALRILLECQRGALSETIDALIRAADVSARETQIVVSAACDMIRFGATRPDGARRLREAVDRLEEACAVLMQEAP